jgi:preprotein translocase subunit SecG
MAKEKNIVCNQKEMLDAVKKAKKNDVIIYDETQPTKKEATITKKKNSLKDLFGILFSKKKQIDLFNQISDKKEVPYMQRIMLTQIANGIESFLFATLKFLVLLWIFTKYYKSAGFDKAIITLLVIIIVILISSSKEKRYSI